MKQHVLYIHQFFKTPQEGGITRSYDIAKELLRYGYKITILTTHNHKTLENKTIEGMEVIYLPIAYHNTFSFKQRIKAFYQFQKEAIKLGKELKQPDLIYATSTPLNVGYIGEKLAKYFSIPWVFEVRDLWPEAPIQIGAIKNILLKKALYIFEKTLYKSADKIVALSPAIKAHIEQKTETEVILVPNLCNNDRFDYHPNINTNNFIIGYFGAISTANNLSRLLDVAEYISEIDSLGLEFRIYGEGKSLPQIKKRAKNLTNVKLYGKLSKIDLIKEINLCQASYISFLELPVLESCSPNKFFDSLAAGKLIITNTKGWIKELIEQHACGFYAQTPKDFLEKITLYVSQEESLTRAQQNSKKLALNDFDKKKLVYRINGVISACISKA